MDDVFLLEFSGSFMNFLWMEFCFVLPAAVRWRWSLLAIGVMLLVCLTLLLKCGLQDYVKSESYLFISLCINVSPAPPYSAVQENAATLFRFDNDCIFIFGWTYPLLICVLNIWWTRRNLSCMKEMEQWVMSPLWNLYCCHPTIKYAVSNFSFLRHSPQSVLSFASKT